MIQNATVRGDRGLRDRERLQTDKKWVRQTVRLGDLIPFSGIAKILSRQRVWIAAGDRNHPVGDR